VQSHGAFAHFFAFDISINPPSASEKTAMRASGFDAGCVREDGTGAKLLFMCRQAL
jgi:hypothetical protein